MKIAIAYAPKCESRDKAGRYQVESGDQVHYANAKEHEDHGVHPCPRQSPSDGPKRTRLTKGLASMNYFTA